MTGARGKWRKVQFVASTEQAEKETYGTEPVVFTFEKGMACGFFLFVTLPCTCAFKDGLVVVYVR